MLDWVPLRITPQKKNPNNLNIGKDMEEKGPSYMLVEM
jgi:hypothetical protein